MKPLEIVLLVAASAIGGALIMKIAQRPARLLVPAPAPVVAQVQASAPAAVAAPAPAPTPEPAAPKTHARPSPFVPPLPGNPEPIAVAESEPAPVAALPAAVAAAEPPKEEPAPAAQRVPPARDEPENATPPSPPPPEPHKVTLNTGMLLPVRLVDGLSSERNAPGDAFLATLDKELVVDGFVIAERGARVEGRVVASAPGGKMKGTAGIAVELIRLHTSDGQNVTIRTDSFERHAEPDRGGDVEKVAVGAAVGAVIGAAAGGGKGAALGAGVGGGAGAGDVMLTRGKPATLPTETRITFRLREPLTLTERM